MGFGFPEGIFKAMFVIVPVIVGAGFIFTVALMFSPKLRAKMMGKQIKATKYMMEKHKGDLTDIASDSGDVIVQSAKSVYDENKETITSLMDVATGRVEKTARAIKKGLAEDDTAYCKHCGAEIDADSKFCKKCGKEQ